MKIKKNAIVVFVFLGAVFGYPLVAGISTTFGLPNSTISLSLRAVIAFASLYLIFDNLNARLHGPGRILFYCTCLFIILYLLRLTFYTAQSPNNATNFWIWTIGSAVLPVLGLSLAKSHDLNWSQFHRQALLLVLVASVIVALNMSTTVTNESYSYDSGRARLETLNPISLGHLGASLFLLSIATFWQLNKKRGKHAILMLLGIAIGVSLVVASNSRGPIVGTAAAIFFAWLVLRGKGKMVVTLVLVTAVLAFAPILLWFETNYGFMTYSRLFGQSFGQEVNVLARLDMYFLALQAFGISPVFGAGLEIEEIGFYPHNVTLEAFLATGMFGGLAFLVMQILTLRIAWRICRVRKDLIWLSMIIVQYLVAAQFSGALYASPPFWAAVGIAVFASGLIKESSRVRAAPRGEASLA